MSVEQARHHVLRALRGYETDGRQPRVISDGPWDEALRQLRAESLIERRRDVTPGASKLMSWQLTPAGRVAALDAKAEVARSSRAQAVEALNEMMTEMASAISQMPERQEPNVRGLGPTQRHIMRRLAHVPLYEGAIRRWDRDARPSEVKKSIDKLDKRGLVQSRFDGSPHATWYLSPAGRLALAQFACADAQKLVTRYDEYLSEIRAERDELEAQLRGE